MKLHGFVGKGTGKLGSSVFAVSGGEQIVRQYNPNVSNPSTDAQVAQRAKLKLMSQIAASLSGILAFKKNGLVSARNLFIKKNIELCDFEDGKATVNVPDIAITPGMSNAPSYSVAAGTGDTIDVTGSFPALGGVKKAVVASVIVNFDDTLLVDDVKIVDVADDGTFTANVKKNADGQYIFAYGLKFASSDAYTRYQNYVATVVNQEAYVDSLVRDLISVGDAQKSLCSWERVN